MLLSPFALIDAWLSPPPEFEKVRWIGKHVFAHRGLHEAGRPENSPSAFAAAIEHGFGIECDLQRTGDGKVMVFHDWELGRLTGDEGPVATRSEKELVAIALGDSADHIPTLNQFLAQVAGQVPLLIEVKSKRELPVAAFCAVIRDALADYTGLHAVMSFDPRVSRWFAINSPKTVRGLVATEEGARGLGGRFSRRLAFWHARPDFLAYDIRDLPSALPARQRARGFPLATWTVRSAELMEKAKLHADAPIAEGAGIGAQDE